MAGPYPKFEEAFEDFQEQMKAEFEAFKKELLAEISQIVVGEPFDPLVFRYELLKDIEQKFQQFKEELSLSLEVSTNSPSFLPAQKIPIPQKSKKWYQYPIIAWFFKEV